MVQEADYINDHLIVLKAEQNKIKVDALIEQTFLVWYSLVEGIDLESFSEKEVASILKQNYIIYKEKYRNDIDFTFVFGWILNVAPWYVDLSIDPKNGLELLREAYEASKENKLFKWAIRDQLKLDQTDLLVIEVELKTNFFAYYNHGELIKNYFQRILN
jgi:hypothetical protein